MGESAETGYSDQYERPDSLLDTHGLAAGVLVQPSFLGTGSTYLLDARGEAPDRLRGVAVIEPRTEREELDRLVEADVCGVRLNLISRPVPPLGEQLWSGPRRGTARASA
ncbi:amidohydrolase family protein [Streptomyces sp. NPDC059272]|uniref:amidohydrolase family protein n=1 Tax=Streptomyces sp. NPDC059272 TaxID=3346800 RepID=UPI00368A47D8